MLEHFQEQMLPLIFIYYLFIFIIYLFIYLFIHGKKIHQVHKSKNPET